MFFKNNLFNNITGFHFVKLPAQMGLNLDLINLIVVRSGKQIIYILIY
jgi:hypothetical protein